MHFRKLVSEPNESSRLRPLHPRRIMRHSVLQEVYNKVTRCDGVGLLFSLTAAAKWESGFVLVYGPAATWATSNTGATGVSCSGYIYFRYFENGGWSHYAIGGDPPYPCGGAGVAIAQRERSWKTKLVTTDSVRVAFSEMGFLFEPLGFAPRDMLTGATGPTDIVSTGDDDHWAVAFVDANKSVQVRDLVDGSGGGFRLPIVFTPPLPANDHVVGGAAIAYDGTRLVLVWPRTTGNRAFRYAVATYSAGATQATVIASGDVPAVAGYVSEFQASASLMSSPDGLMNRKRTRPSSIHFAT